jgi:DNA-binding phage protein
VLKLTRKGVRVEFHKRVAAGEQKAGLAREYGISSETLYQYLKTTT